MSAPRRRFTVEQKLEILQQAKQSGIIAALRRHNLSYSVFHRWKEKLSEQGKDVSPKKMSDHVNTRLKELLDENVLLKKIIANQVMLLELKEEELRNRKP
jgi:putative transposase